MLTNTFSQLLWMPINICKRDLCFQFFYCTAHNTAVSWQFDVAITHDLHSKIPSIAKNHRNIISSMNRTSSTSRALQTSEKTNQRKVRELDIVMPHEGHTRTHEPVWKGAPGAACTLVFERILQPCDDVMDDCASLVVRFALAPCSRLLPAHWFSWHRLYTFPDILLLRRSCSVKSLALRVSALIARAYNYHSLLDGLFEKKRKQPSVNVRRGRLLKPRTTGWANPTFLSSRLFAEAAAGLVGKHQRQMQMGRYEYIEYMLPP